LNTVHQQLQTPTSTGINAKPRRTRMASIAVAARYKLYQLAVVVRYVLILPPITHRLFSVKPSLAISEQ